MDEGLAGPAHTTSRFRPWRRCASWPIAEIPGALSAFIVVMEITALLVVASVVLLSATPGRAAVATAVALMAIGVAHTEASRRWERDRVRTTLPHFIDLTSVWIFAGAVALPPALVWPGAVVICTHLWVRTARPRVAYYRHLYSMTTMVLAALGASATLAAVSAGEAVGAGTVLLAVVVFTTINTGLVAIAIAVSTAQPSAATLFGDLDDNVLELATLCLGAMVVVGFRVHPALALFLAPALAVLHRAVRVKHLAGAASQDGKTGLLTAAAWQQRAEAAMADRRRGACGVLVLDLDHFKRVNDTYGHLVGDQVLRAVAGAVSGEVRERDLVGRFGGEEFVVMLSPSAPGEDDVERVAERIRQAVAALSLQVATPDGPLTVVGVTVSIGTALVDRAQGSDLQQLLQSADAALYEAKRGGRNQVRSGPALAAPAPVPSRSSDGAAPFPA